MNKVYFSKAGDADKWVEDKDSGQFNIILVPKRWWSIKDWKLCVKFQKNFRSGFVTYEQTN